MSISIHEIAKALNSTVTELAELSARHKRMVNRVTHLMNYNLLDEMPGEAINLALNDILNDKDVEDRRGLL